MIKLSYPPGIDGQFCKLMEDCLPKITYWQREQKYSSVELAKEMPNLRPDKDFFKKWAKEIFRKPYDQYERDKNAEKFLSSKKEVMLKFLSYLRKYSFTEFGPTTFANVFKELDELMARLNPEQHRDHVLHQGNVFLLGLLCYCESSFIRKEHEEMLSTWPDPPGCIARDKTTEFQFFEQWLNAAAIHDVGYIFEILAEPELEQFDFIDEVVSLFNRWLETIVSGVPGLAAPSKVSFDRGSRKLDVSDLYQVKYLWPAEAHLTRGNLWRETLEEIKKTESRAKREADHGICTAKVLLKTGNVVVKWEEVNKEADPSARFSCRNYVLPALAVARHNARPQMVSANDNTTFDCLKRDFENEFLACLLAICDEASEFDRKVSGSLRLGIKLQAEIIDADPHRFSLRLNQL